MPRFAVHRTGAAIEVVFDDGGMNLLSEGALRELGGVVESAGEDTRAPNAARLLTFRSGRPGLFAAGADMAEMASFDARDAEAFSRLGQELFAAFEALPMLTVALIDGDCFGGALDLALAFDLRFATPRSRFAHPGARLGIVTGFGGTSRWRKVLNRSAAHALFSANAVIDAATAERSGIVDAVVETFDEKLRALTAADPHAVRLVKELTIHAPALSRSQLLLLARRLGNLYFG